MLLNFDNLKKAPYPNWQTFWVGILVFLIPSNLFLKFSESSAYVNGLLVDYLIPKLYVSDLVIFILLGSWCLHLIFQKKISFKKISIPKIINQNKIFFLLFFTFVISQFFTPKPLASIWYLGKLIEIGLLVFFLFKHSFALKSPFFYFSLIASLIFQSILAIYQFGTQSSLASYLLLGEPALSNYIGLNKGTFNGVEKILPYGTTAHPNILGGFLVIGLLILSDKYLFDKKSPTIKFLLLLILIPTIITIFLTQSISAWITLICGLLLIIFYKTKHKLFLKLSKQPKIILLNVLTIILISPLFIYLANHLLSNHTSFDRRNYLNTAALQMSSQNPWIGVGLNNFTARVEEYSLSREVVRFIQPTHHIPLLYLAETGILGTALLFLIWNYFNKNSTRNQQSKIYRSLALILILFWAPLSFDHYLLTQQTGLLLIIFTSLFFFEKSKNSEYSLQK